MPLAAIDNAFLFAAVIVTVAVAGVPRLAAVAEDSATEKLLPPAPVVEIGTANVLAVASPAVQFKVPEVPVKSAPETAVPALVAYLTLAAVLEPGARSTVTVTWPDLVVTP